jgi:hypothetical protein
MAVHVTVSRRGALFGLTAGALAAGWAVPVVAAAAPMPAWAPKALTTDQAQALSAAVDRIMPATDTPGGVEAGVPQFIDRALANWAEPPDAARLKAGLDRLNADARKAGAASFAALTPVQQDAELAALEAEAKAAGGKPHVFYQLRELVTAGYFTSQLGATKAVRYDPVPGPYRGCVPLAEIGRAWAT